MTVGRLIRDLQKWNPEAEVKMRGRPNESVIFVIGQPNDKEIYIDSPTEEEALAWLGSWHDRLIKTEANASYNCADSEIRPVYADMVDKGFTLPLLIKAFGAAEVNRIYDECYRLIFSRNKEYFEPMINRINCEKE